MKTYFAKASRSVRNDDGKEERGSRAVAGETKGGLDAERENPVVDGHFERRNEREPTLP